jgi:hypothetical protein
MPRDTLPIASPAMLRRILHAPGPPTAAVLAILAAISCRSRSEPSLDAGKPDPSLRAPLPSVQPPPIPAPGHTRYPREHRHSPMTRAVVDTLAPVLANAGARADVFAKVGDSITAHGHFLNCLAGDDVRWHEHEALHATRLFFLKTRADASHSSFDRQSLAARSGWSTRIPIRGAPPPLEREFAAIRPAFAVVMMGTNDVYPDGIGAYERNLRALVDRCLASGVIPLVSTIPPMTWNAQSASLIPEMNAVVAAVAQSRQVPLMDYHEALAASPGRGLGKDGIHPEAFRTNGLARPCWFSPEALQKGMNARNLIVLEALDRARRFLLDREEPEAEPPPLRGTGGAQDPIEIPGLPFSDARPCGRSGDSDHADERYRLTLQHPTRVRIRVFGDDGVRVAAFLRTTASEPLAPREIIDAAVGPGEIDFVVRASGCSPAGGYRVTVAAVAP